MFGYSHLNPAAFNIDKIPAVFGAPAEDSVSKKYEAIPTASLVGLMDDLGWKPVAGSQIKSRKRSNPLTVKHALVFQDQNAKANENGVTGQIVLVNSHDAKSSYRLYYGLYRFVCANGLMVGDELAQAKIRHMGKDAVYANIAESTAKFVKHSADVNSQIDRWMNIKLSCAKQLQFAKDAALLRFGGEKAEWFRPEAFLAARNSEDQANSSLWSTFNRVQENLVKGGASGRSPKRRIRLRGISGVDSCINFNRDLWNLAGEYAAAA